MMMDFLTLGVGLLSFVIFLLVHVITFRWLRPEELLRSLLVCVSAVAVLPLVLMCVLFVIKAADASPEAWIIAALSALLLTGLSCFVYVICVFGPYETSIRMRLVREIAKGGSKGISHQELLGNYNDKAIVNIRLRRLAGSGDIIEEKGLYRQGSTRNIFFLFDTISGMIKEWIG